jgi:hypothetical protein
MTRRSIRDTTGKAAITKVVVAGAGRTRQAELLILCARIDFNP